MKRCRPNVISYRIALWPMVKTQHVRNLIYPNNFIFGKFARADEYFFFFLFCVFRRKVSFCQLPSLGMKFSLFFPEYLKFNMMHSFELIKY